MPWPEDTGQGYEVTLPNGEVLSVNPATGEVTIIHQGAPGQDNPPTSPGTITPDTKFVPPGQSPLVQGGGGGVGPMPDWQQFIIWSGALVVLWFVLTAASEGGYGKLANGFAGLIVFGALLYMGPDRGGHSGAISNAMKLVQPRQGG